jgi:hypothetical protein
VPFRRFAHTSIEEQGINILYLALGMLNWYESESSEDCRIAPLILIPAALSRSDARARFALALADDDIADNVRLQASGQGNPDQISSAPAPRVLTAAHGRPSTER